MLSNFDLTLTFIWPTRSYFLFCFICHKFHLLIDFTHIWTKPHLWPNVHVGWFWYYLDLYMILTNKFRFFSFALIIITFSFIDGFNSYLDKKRYLPYYDLVRQVYSSSYTYKNVERWSHYVVSLVLMVLPYITAVIIPSIWSLSRFWASMIKIIYFDILFWRYALEKVTRHQK